jgi:RNA polymerase I-specific transcription initiation factor RRN7
VVKAVPKKVADPENTTSKTARNTANEVTSKQSVLLYTSLQKVSDQK